MGKPSPLRRVALGVTVVVMAVLSGLWVPAAVGHASTPAPVMGSSAPFSQNLPSTTSSYLPDQPRPDGPPPASYTLVAWNQLCATGTGAGACFPSPAQSFKAASFWDPVDDYLVYFGGTSSSAASLNTTFLWANGSWTRDTPPTAPTIRSNATGVWDIQDGYGVIFGGWTSQSGGFVRTDTWTFLAGHWTHLNPTPTPNARAGYSMVYIPKNGTTGGYALLFGGKGNGTAYKSDTWEFNNGNWTNITGTAGTPPAARAQAAMTWDSIDNYALLFGGITATGVVNDTWKFSPTTQAWTQLFTNGSSTAHAGPKAVMDAQLATDTQAGATYLVNGATGTLKNTTSEVVIASRSVYYFRGGQWTNYTTLIGQRTTGLGFLNPVPMYGGAFVYSPSDLVVYLVGGRFFNVGAENETFELGSFASVTFASNMGEVLVNHAVKFWANATNVVAPYTTSWNNLPTGCVSSNVTVLTCTPTGGGVFLPSASIVDSVGNTGTSGALRIVVDALSQANVTLALGAYSASPPSTFWGGDDQGSHTNLTADAIEIGYLKQTPIKWIRQVGSLEGADVVHSKWYIKGGVLAGAFPSTYSANLTNAATWCRALGCIAIYDAPASENNTTSTEAVINYVQNVIGFTPTVWALGNEPQGWTQYPLQFTQFNTSYVNAPKPTQYGGLAQYLTNALNAAYPGIKVMSLQSAACGANGFILNVSKFVGTGMGVLGCHLYAGGGHGLNMTSAMLSARNITRLATTFPTTANALLGQCGRCTNVPIFVNEYNAGVSNLFCNYQVSWPEVAFLGASIGQAMLANVSDVGLFSIDYGNSCFDSLFGPGVVPHPAYYLYSYIFNNLHFGQVYTTSFAGAFNGAYAVETTNATGKSLMVVNANTSVTMDLNSLGGFPVGGGATVYTGYNPTWTVTTYSAGAVPSTFAIPPMGVLLVNIASSSSSSAGGGSGTPTNLTVLAVTSSSVTLGWLYGSLATYYLVRYGPSCSTLTSTAVVYGEPTTIGNLLPFTPYCFVVAAGTTVGPTAYSSPTTVRTAILTVPPLPFTIPPVTPLMIGVVIGGVVTTGAGASVYRDYRYAGSMMLIVGVVVIFWAILGGVR